MAKQVVHFSLPDSGAVLGARRHAAEECVGADHPNAPSRSAIKPSTETLIE